MLVILNKYRAQGVTKSLLGTPIELCDKTYIIKFQSIYGYESPKV